MLRYSFLRNIGMVSCLVTGLAFAAAPVEDVDSSSAVTPVVAMQAKVVANDDVVAQNSGRRSSLDSLPQARWEDASTNRERYSMGRRSNTAAKTDGNNNASATVAVGAPIDSSLSQTEQVTRLRQQVNNIVQMNLPQQVKDLEQQVAQLRGQLQVQQHSLQVLNTQQRSFYQSIDARINQLKNEISGPSSSGVMPPNQLPNSDDSATGGNKDSSGQVKADNQPAKQRKDSASLRRIHYKDSAMYQAAFDQLMKKKYVEAKAEFARYLVRYPHGQYVPHVNYWLGEIALINKKYVAAEGYFNAVVRDHSKSAKMADASYKLAVTHGRMGKKSLAKKEFRALKKRYAGKTVARLASLQLQQIQLNAGA